jgi:hypothetical protein
METVGSRPAERSADLARGSAWRGLVTAKLDVPDADDLGLSFRSYLPKNSIKRGATRSGRRGPIYINLEVVERLKVPTRENR